MNVAIFTPSQNPYSETFIQAHKMYLVGNISFYFGRRNIQLEGEDIRFGSRKRRWLQLKKKAGLKNYRSILELEVLQSLKNKKIDVILVEYGTHAHDLLPILKSSSLPFVVHFHGYDASRIKALHHTDNYKKVFREAAAVIAVSIRMQTMLKEMGCPEEKLFYNVYGPQPEFLEVHSNFSKPQLVGLGRFTDKKAPYYTILAFHRVANDFPEAKLVLAGDGALWNTCQNLVRALGLESRVELVGVITQAQYRAYLSESRAFVQHSITATDGDMEGTPLAVLEASAAGLPVIATFHAGIPDVIIDGKTGLLCNEHDVDAMAMNMRKLLNSDELSKKMGEAGKQRIQTSFTLERHIEALQKILAELL